MNTLWIRYGGSNRKMESQHILLKRMFPEFRDAGYVGRGHWSNRHGTINDTPENREAIKGMEGVTIARRV